MAAASYVWVNGKVFASMADAEGVLGVSAGTVSHWLKSKPEQARKITKEEYFDTLIEQSKAHDAAPKPT